MDARSATLFAAAAVEATSTPAATTTPASPPQADQPAYKTLSEQQGLTKRKIVKLHIKEKTPDALPAARQPLIWLKHTHCRPATEGKHKTAATTKDKGSISKRRRQAKVFKGPTLAEIRDIMPGLKFRVRHKVLEACVAIFEAEMLLVRWAEADWQARVRELNTLIDDFLRPMNRRRARP